MDFAQYYQNGPMMDGWDNGNGWIGLAFMLLFFVLLVLVAYYVVRAINGNHTAQTDYRDPLDIAKERFAKGEITKDEFNDIRKELK